MIKPMQATSDGDAYESNDVEGIWTAGISLPFKPEPIFSRSMDPVWNSRIECHGESKEDAEELRDAVLAVVTTQQVPTDGEWERFGSLLALEGSPRLIDAWNKLHSQSATRQAPQPVVGGSQPQQGAVAFKCERARIVGWWNCQCGECRERSASNTIGQLAVDDAMKGVLASLVAAISLLERGGKKAAPSNHMFEQMLADYRKAVEQGRAALAAHGKERPATHRSDGSDWLDYGVTPADHERRARHFAGIDQQAGADANLRQAAQTVIDRFLPDKREYIFSKRVALEKLAEALAKPPAPVEPVPYIELGLYEDDKETQYPGYHRVRIPYDAWSWEIDHNGLLTNRIDIVFPTFTGGFHKIPITRLRAFIDGTAQIIKLDFPLVLGPVATTPMFRTRHLALATESP